MMLRRNFKYKLLAFIFAVAIWYYANAGQNLNVYRETSVPVEIRNLQPDLIVVKKPVSVKLRLLLPKSQANRILDSYQTTYGYVNLMDKSEGRYKLPVGVKRPGGEREALEISTIPEKVDIAIQKRFERTMNVEIEFLKSTPVGYSLGTPQLSPSRVTVSGTSAKVKSVSRLIVSMDEGQSVISGIDGDFSVSAQDKDGKPVRDLILVPNKIHIRLDVKEALSTRVVLISPNITGLPEFPYRVDNISVEPQTAVISGDPNLLLKVGTLMTEPVRLTSLKSGFTKEVKLIAPDGVTLVKPEPVKLTVNIVSGK
jgi:YbbR domain-containing protein